MSKILPVQNLLLDVVWHLLAFRSVPVVGDSVQIDNPLHDGGNGQVQHLPVFPEMWAYILETLRKPFLDDGHDMPAILIVLVLIVRGEFSLRDQEIDIRLNSVDVPSHLARRNGS